MRRRLNAGHLLLIEVKLRTSYSVRRCCGLRLYICNDFSLHSSFE